MRSLPRDVHASIRVQTTQGVVQLGQSDEVITFVNRNLEPYRGFHVFMRALEKIQKDNPQIHFTRLYTEVNYTKGQYSSSMEALVEGGSDVLLVETIFDTLNAKAALFAIDEYFEASGERLPVIISGTVTDASGRILSGQTVTAFWASVRHIQPLAVGLNCALGATLMRPYIQELAKVAGDTFISCYPNAGLPNPMSDTGFDETPDVTSRLLREFAAEGLVNIVGGCCGTTPEHIGAIHDSVRPLAPRQRTAFYREAA